MPKANTDTRYTTDLVAGLADAGVDTVFISPGSRNTPLTIAFASEPRIRDISFRDERSAGFAALGYGKAAGRPAVAVCTSGSAATHYFPAIVEADQAGSPLIVLTADRPSRLRGTGAPQTMNQIDLYGSHVKAFIDLDVGGDTGRSDGAALVREATTLPAGPVHANASFDEPLLPQMPVTPGEPRSWDAPGPEAALRGGALERLVGRRILIVAGGRQQPGFSEAVNAVADALSAPVIADPQCWVTGANTVHHGALLLACDAVTDALQPDVVLRLGPIPTSKALWMWLEHSGIEQILVDRSRLADPLASAATRLDADPTAFLRANLPAAVSNRSFLDAWRAVDEAAGVPIRQALAELTFPNEPEIARTLVTSVPSGSVLYVASSMPIRDVDAFAEPRRDVTVLANRGVNGIDGTISSALGAALAGTPVTLLLGDVAALHDATALSEAASVGAPMRIVVINNDGGGIFSFLPQTESEVIDAATFERHWGTPHGLSLVAIAAAMGLEARQVDAYDDYASAVSAPISEPSLIELRTNRHTNVEHHHAIRSAVSAALATGSHG
ncbi:MAG: 2-succinyl-5-enolpyruvyl-6-hydroxy-3-cyclohexene-1-carboxylic-acid synthase [Actinomycetota bacterium]|nr:2-succinyl-5-enolpyruvyl-6-hydroxy-3-cyclohexene-1-carboxylic-acid synthase [Actinomycetota bacterium]